MVPFKTYPTNLLVCAIKTHLETNVLQLRDRVEALESEIKRSQEQLEKVNDGVFASLHRMIKASFEKSLNRSLPGM